MDVLKFSCCNEAAKSIDEFKRHIWSTHLAELVAPPNRKSDMVAKPLDEVAKSSQDHKQKSVKSKAETTTTTAAATSQKRSEHLNLDGIDESQLYERTQRAFYPNKSELLSSTRELNKGTVAWGEWTIRKAKVMWPCVVTGIEKPKTMIKYIEFIPENSKYNFKLGPGKVEPMFESKKHFENLKQTLEAEGVDRHEFLTCYTRAVQDHLKLVEEKEASRLEEEASSQKTTDNRKGNFLIRDNWRSLEDIQNIINQPVSSNLQQVEKKREEYSKKILEAILQPECQEFLISIMNNKTECSRHSSYLTADASTRRKMQFCSTGPLKSDEQEKLAAHLIKLSKEHFVNKPAHLRNYEYDVLYPEAVIWGIRKLERYSYKRAEEKYLLGFNVTEEERMRRQCREILNQNMTKFESQKTQGLLQADEELADISASSSETSSAKEN